MLGEGWWVGLVVARPEVTANEEGGEKRVQEKQCDGQETPDLKGSPCSCPDAGLSLAAPPATLFSQEVPHPWLLAALLGLVPFHPGPQGDTG